MLVVKKGWAMPSLAHSVVCLFGEGERAKTEGEKREHRNRDDSTPVPLTPAMFPRLAEGAWHLPAVAGCSHTGMFSGPGHSETTLPH